MAWFSLRVREVPGSIPGAAHFVDKQHNENTSKAVAGLYWSCWQLLSWLGSCWFQYFAASQKKQQEPSLFVFTHNRHDSVTEWLRWWTRNPLGSARRGSNPLAVVLTLALHWMQIEKALGYCCFFPFIDGQHHTTKNTSKATSGSHWGCWQLLHLLGSFWFRCISCKKQDEQSYCLFSIIHKALTTDMTVWPSG